MQRALPVWAQENLFAPLQEGTIGKSEATLKLWGKDKARW